MISTNVLRVRCITLILVMAGARSVIAQTENPPASPQAPQVVSETADVAPVQRTIYFARHAAVRNLIYVLQNHFAGDDSVKLYAEPNGNLLSIRANSQAALDHVLKILEQIDRPSRQVVIHLHLIEFILKKPESGEEKTATLPVKPEELNGPFSEVQPKLKNWITAGHVSRVRRFELKGLENTSLQLNLGENKPTVTAYNTNALTGSFLPIVTYRSFGTVIDVTPRITENGVIETKLNLSESHQAEQDRGVEVVKTNDKSIVVPATTNHRLETTLLIPDGQASVAACAQDAANVGESPLLVLVSAYVIDLNRPVPVATVDYTTPYSAPVPRTVNESATSSTKIIPPTTNTNENVQPTGFARTSLRRNLTTRSILAESRRNEGLSKKLMLTDEQLKKLDAIVGEYNEFVRSANRFGDRSDETTEKLKELYQKTLDVLNDDQKKVWAEHQQEINSSPAPPAFNPPFSPPRQRNVPRTEDPNTSATDRTPGVSEPRSIARNQRLQQDVSEPPSLHQRIEKFLETQQYDLAVADLRTAIQSEPHATINYARLAVILAYLDDEPGFKKCLSEWKKQIETSPAADNAEAWRAIEETSLLNPAWIEDRDVVIAELSKPIPSNHHLFETELFATRFPSSKLISDSRLDLLRGQYLLALNGFREALKRVEGQDFPITELACQIRLHLAITAKSMGDDELAQSYLHSAEPMLNKRTMTMLSLVNQILLRQVGTISRHE